MKEILNTAPKDQSHVGMLISIKICMEVLCTIWLGLFWIFSIFFLKSPILQWWNESLVTLKEGQILNEPEGSWFNNQTPKKPMLAVVLVPIRVYTLRLNQAAKVFTRHLVTFCIRFGSFTKCLGISPRYLWKETLVCIFQTLLWTVRRFEESSGCIYNQRWAAVFTQSPAWAQI